MHKQSELIDACGGDLRPRQVSQVRIGDGQRPRHGAARLPQRGEALLLSTTPGPMDHQKRRKQTSRQVSPAARSLRDGSEGFTPALRVRGVKRCLAVIVVVKVTRLELPLP